MIPSRKWFPASLQERSAWLLNFRTNLTPVAASLGILPAELTSLDLDIEDFQALAAISLSVENFKSAVREYRISFSEGDIGDPSPVWPPISGNAPPNAPRPAGFFQRIVEMVARIRAAPAYTDEIGASLGIIPQEASSISPGDVKPLIEAFAAQADYVFAVIVSNRAEASAWTVSVQPKNGEWAEMGTFTGKSADLTYAPATPGNPVALTIRVQLKRNNANYGQLSDIVAITVTP